MSRARDLALITTSDCIDAIDANRKDTTHMNAVFPAQNLAELSEVTVHNLVRVKDEGPTMLHSRNSKADHKKWSGK